MGGPSLPRRSDGPMASLLRAWFPLTFHSAPDEHRQMDRLNPVPAKLCVPVEVGPQEMNEG